MPSIVTEAYRTAIDTGKRGKWNATVYIDGKAITGKDVKSIKLEEMELEGSSLGIGSVVSSIVYITLLNNNIEYSNKSLTFTIELNMGISKQAFTFQTFYITEAEPDNEKKTVDIVAMDGIKKTNIPYVTALTYPNTFENVAKEFARKCGLKFNDSTVWDDITIKSPIEESTVRGAFKVLGQLVGKNLIMNRNSELEFRFFNQTDIKITPNKTYTGGKIGDVLSYIYSVSMSDGENTYTARGTSKGSGYNAINLQINNVYATQAIVNSVLDKISLAYRPANFSFIGDPSVCVGDIVTLVDATGIEHSVPVMKNILEYDGGVKNSVESYSETEEAQELTQNVKKDVIKKSELLAEALKKARDLIDEWSTAGNVLYGQHELVIGDSDTIETSMNLWRWNLGGLMHYSHGIDGPVDDAGVAITMDGHINGKYITANTISAEAISVSYRQTVQNGIDAANQAAEDAETNANAETDRKLENYWTTEQVTTAISNADNAVRMYVKSATETIIKKNYIINGEQENIALDSFSFNGSCATATIVNFLNTKCIKIEFVEAGTFRITQSIGVLKGSFEFSIDTAYPEEKEPTGISCEYGGWWLKLSLPDKPNEFTTIGRSWEADGTSNEKDALINISGEVGDICYITNIRFLRKVQEALDDLEAKVDVEIGKINLSVTDIYENMEQNLIMDGDFKDANIGSYWQLTNEDDISRATFLSKRCAKISSASCVLRQYMKVQKAGTYTLRFKVAGSSSSAVVNYNIHGTNFSFSPLSSSEWQTVTKDIDLPAGEVFSVYFTSAVSGTIVYITDVEFIGYVGSGYSQSYIRILKDSITSQVEKATELEKSISTVKQTADNISTEVKKKVGNDEIISKINQSAESVTISASKINLTGSAVQVAFNKWDDTMKFHSVSMDSETTAAMSIYNSSGKLKMRLHSKGAQYYNPSGKRIGLIGTQEFNSTGKYSLEFKLRDNGSYMTWYDEANNIMTWSYMKNTVGSFGSGTLHAQVPIHMHGFTIFDGYFSSTSDERLKTNIIDADVSALEAINSLEMKQFDWIESGQHDELGLIADQVLVVCPEMVTKSEPWLNINMNKILMYLVKAVQELSETFLGDVALYSDRPKYKDDTYTLEQKKEIIRKHKEMLTLQVNNINTEEKIVENIDIEEKIIE